MPAVLSTSIKYGVPRKPVVNRWPLLALMSSTSFCATTGRRLSGQQIHYEGQHVAGLDSRYCERFRQA